MNNDKTIMYKKTWGASEDGVTVFTEKWIAVYETPCFYFCVSEFDAGMAHTFRSKDETDLEYFKRNKMLKRISKINSRFAFDTEQKSLDHLRFLKRKQLAHMQRDTVLIGALLAASDEDLLNGCAPGTRGLVAEYYVFD